MALGGILRRAVVSGGVRFGTIIGLCTFDDLPAALDAKVAYAAAFGQARWRHGRRPTLAEVYGVLDTTGREDYAVLTAAGGIHNGAGVEPLLMRCWPAVCGTAARLWRDREIGHPDVCAELRLSTDPETRAVELSLIRCGSTPGTFRVSRPVPP